MKTRETKESGKASVVSVKAHRRRVKVSEGSIRLSSGNYKIGKEKFVTNKSGKIESVVLPVDEYNKLIELIEDYGLGLAMKQVEADEFISKEKALKYLENDKS